MTRRYSTPSFEYPTADVFAAACAAQRINGEYLKVNKEVYNDDGSHSHTESYANKFLVPMLLEGKFDVLDSDRENAALVMTFFRGLSFRILTGEKLSDFDATALKLVDQPVVNSRYDIAVISSLPSCYVRGVERKSVDARLRDSVGYLGSVGDKVTASVEVVKCFYSQNWDTFFVTAITDKNEAVMFSYRERVEVGTALKIKGTVKSLRDDNLTQLNRVKVL